MNSYDLPGLGDIYLAAEMRRQAAMLEIAEKLSERARKTRCTDCRYFNPCPKCEDEGYCTLFNEWCPHDESCEGYEPEVYGMNGDEDDYV